MGGVGVIHGVKGCWGDDHKYRNILRVNLCIGTWLSYPQKEADFSAVLRENVTTHFHESVWQMREGEFYLRHPIRLPSHQTTPIHSPSNLFD
ncbi:hypothetical protein TNCV_4277851 [Trichonephila clavipes]|nr:hypothetical protein TNCV_4277851 [Trichonephila clavipes]